MQWAGWRWRELYQGDPLPLNDGMTLVWTFQFIPRQEFRREGH